MKGIVVITMMMLLLQCIVIAVVFVLIATFSASASDGRFIYDGVYSPSLEGNLLGDSPKPRVMIYLPPGYDENTDTRYPVIYLLHGYIGDHLLWRGGGYFMGVGGINIEEIANTLIGEGTIRPMIIVMPNAKNTYLGSFYTNSSVSGNWEDFMTQDLVAYVDSTYRTLPQAASRGIAGHSMGGYGSIKLAMKHPDIYSAVYSLSASNSFNHDIVSERDSFIKAANATSFDVHTPVRVIIAEAVAFSPNPDAQPFMCDFPLDKNGELVESTWQRWLSRAKTRPSAVLRSAFLAKHCA